jgi:hypothetical protein
LDQTLDWITVHRRIWDERFDKLEARLSAVRSGRRDRTGTVG